MSDSGSPSAHPVSSKAAADFDPYLSPCREACAWIVVSRVWRDLLGELEVRVPSEVPREPPDSSLVLDGDPLT